MALVTPIKYALSAPTGSPGYVTFYTPTAGLTLADIQEISDALVPSLDAATDLKIDRAYATVPLTLPGTEKANANAEAEPARGANLLFNVPTNFRNYHMRIPGVEASLIIGESVNIASGPLLTLSGLIIAGITTSGGLKPLTNQAGEDINAILRGTKSTRRD